MVTIEQKLALFSKLLQQDISGEMSEQLEKLEQDYESIIKEHKVLVDLKAQEIMERSQKRAESKKIEYLSKANMQTKRAYMKAKEKQVNRFMDALTKQVERYVITQQYGDYLEQLVASLYDLANESAVVVYMTAKDLANHEGHIQKSFEKLGVQVDRLIFKEKDAAMMGGLIIENEQRTMRIDLSIASRIREHKEMIIRRIFEALGEVGE
ncbi:MAG: V-type ATP synthase subunit E [Cellulosilyticaceae bacterium]